MQPKQDTDKGALWGVESALPEDLFPSTPACKREGENGNACSPLCAWQKSCLQSLLRPSLVYARPNSAQSGRSACPVQAPRGNDEDAVHAMKACLHLLLKAALAAEQHQNCLTEAADTAYRTENVMECTSACAGLHNLWYTRTHSRTPAPQLCMPYHGQYCLARQREQAAAC